MYGSVGRNDYDYSCHSCGKGYYAEVGMGPITCPHCGGPIDKPSPPPADHPDDDVLLDDRYILFDPLKAFRILRDLGRLDEAMYDGTDDTDFDIDVREMP